jgi:hypothetical protein
MSAFSRFLKNRQGNVVDKVVLYSAIVAVLCTLGAHAMDDLGASGYLPMISFNWRNTNPGVDYTATASIPDRAQATHLDPCRSK